MFPISSTVFAIALTIVGFVTSSNAVLVLGLGALVVAAFLLAIRSEERIVEVATD